MLFLFAGEVFVGVDVQDEELAADSFGHAGAARDQHLRGAVGADADGNAFADSPVGLDALRVHVGGQRAVDGLGDMLQGKFAKRDQVAAAKEVGEGFFGAVDAVDIAAAHAGLKRLRRQIGHHDLVGALHQPVRHGLANRDAGDALHGGCDALDVLHVHGCENVDVGGEHVEHILVALAVFAAFDVGVGELVDQDDLRAVGRECRRDPSPRRRRLCIRSSVGEFSRVVRPTPRCADGRGFRRRR